MRRAALPVFLAIQAALSFWNLGLLSPWMDEAATLDLMRHPLGFVIRLAAEDVHPPLFYLMLWVWQRLPFGLEPAVQARVLTVLIGLLATVAADRLLASRLAENRAGQEAYPTARICFLALWCLSPCVLLYDRMCRSYSLQVLVTVVAVGCLMRKRGPLVQAPAVLAALYTHYVPGLALLAVVNLAILAKRRWRDLAVFDAAVAVGMLPWGWWLVRSLANWGRHEEAYALAGVGMKIGYLLMSFTVGEAAPDWVLIAAAILMPVFAWTVWRGARQEKTLGWIAAGLGVIGFLGVAHWVSYPFVPARLLFVLPLVLLLVAASQRVAVVAALLVLSLVGDWCYFHRTGFRNKDYPMPMREIAGTIGNEPGSLVLIDSINSDTAALEYALGPSREVLQTGRADTPQRLADPGVRVVWFLRSTHDISPGSLNTRFEMQLRQEMRLERVRSYEPFTPLERWAMRVLGMESAPRYFSELLEFRKAVGQTSRSARVLPDPPADVDVGRQARRPAPQSPAGRRPALR